MEGIRMEADIVSRVDKLEAELRRLKYMIEAKTLHDYVTEELHRVKAVNELEIKERLKKHELLKNRISSRMVVEDPQAVLDEVRGDRDETFS
jgi:predicted transcriptional regulator